MKRCLGVFIWIVLLISFSSANIHDASNIYLKINGVDTNLQTAISSGNFSSSYTGESYSLPVLFGHKATEIVVNVNGTIKSFAVAISDGILNSTLAGRSPAVYTGHNMIFGEYGTNITIVNRSGVQKSLQTAINDGEFSLRGSCGNGIIEVGEVCDDGNVIDNDGCSADCSNETGCQYTDPSYGIFFRGGDVYSGIWTCVWECRWVWNNIEIGRIGNGIPAPCSLSYIDMTYNACKALNPSSGGYSYTKGVNIRLDLTIKDDTICRMPIA